jgi:tetratricopeptide (TPR) repeat protein
MQAFVFTDKRLERYAGQFVWLQVDIDNAKNAAFLAKYPTPAIPTLLIIDPAKESVALRYVSGATVPQMIKLLDDGKRAVQPRKTQDSDALLVQADALASSGKTADAIPLYEKALANAPKSWARLGRAAEAYETALMMSNATERCANTALQYYPKLKGTNSGANLAAAGLACAAELGNAQSIATLEAATREALADKTIPLSGDDKSGMYQSLISARQALKDEAGQKAVTVEWANFLDAEAARAKTAEERTVYDSHRLSAYMELGTPEKAIPMLEQSEKDFPNDYNPPARLAAAYKAIQKYDEALAASDRALKLVYGPRKVTVLRGRADIYLAKGDKESARKTLQEALDYANALPTGQRNERTIAALKKKMDAIAQ